MSLLLGYYTLFVSSGLVVKDSSQGNALIFTNEHEQSTTFYSKHRFQPLDAVNVSFTDFQRAVKSETRALRSDTKHMEKTNKELNAAIVSCTVPSFRMYEDIPILSQKIACENLPTL